jgi:hypothetical protein
MNELPVFNKASNDNVCSWFWGLFILNFGVFIAYAVIMFFRLVRLAGMPIFMKGLIYLLTILAMSVALINAGFMFTMCKRSLK